MPTPWTALDLELPPGLEDTALGALGDACLGAEIRPGSAGRERLVAYFDTPEEARAAAEALDALLRAGGAGPGEPTARIVPVGDGRWAERYQAGLRPLVVGERFLVDPTGRSAPSGGRVRIDLVPGGAFGTGEHATTRMCVGALERHVRPGSRWVDLGCGSGILAVVARHCGAREVLAIDLDAEAVRIAREVVRRNGFETSIRVVRGSHETAEPGAWDGVVANLEAAHFALGAGSLAHLLRGGGRLIVSGLLEGQRPRVRAALCGSGWAVIEDDASDGWCALVLGRKGASSGEPD